ERARLATHGLDIAQAKLLLADAQSSLRAQPELPQAPWLLAEVFSTEAELAQRMGEVELAEHGRRAARALEGPRSSAVGGEPHASVPLLEAQQNRELQVKVPRPGDSLLWNGVQVMLEPRAADVWLVDAVPGLHHARVLRHDKV